MRRITQSAREPVINRLLEAHRAIAYLTGCSMDEVGIIIERALKMLDYIEQQDMQEGLRRGE